MAGTQRTNNNRTNKVERDLKKEAYEAQVEAYVQEELKKRERRRKILILLCSMAVKKSIRSAIIYRFKKPLKENMLRCCK